MLKVSEGYLVGIDISEHDEAVVQVIAIEGTSRKLVNQFRGAEAMLFYSVLKGEQPITFPTPLTSAN
jgi:hypothetical protein